MIVQDFIKQADLNSESQIFAIKSGHIVVVDEGIITIAFYAGVDLSGIVWEIFSKEVLESIFAHKPRVYTGKKWTDLSKKRVNNELKTWPSMPQDVFSLADIEPILQERQRLRKLEPCYTYEYLRDYAHYKKGLSWSKSAGYANYACCNCCYE